MHDELGQALTGLKMDLVLMSAEGRNGDRADPASLSAAIDSMIGTVQRISSELRPQILDDLGLLAALEWHAREFQKRTGVRCRFRHTGTPDSVDAESIDCHLSIFQEMMTNVARHARATRVQITLAAGRGSISLVVRDNGRGIGEVPKAHQQRLGLLGMQERAAAFGGRVTIAGAPPRGTTVRVRIPIVKSRKAGGS